MNKEEINEKEIEKLREQILDQLEHLPKEQAEQASVLKEQIKKASSEQLEEFIKAQMQAAKTAKSGECLFCQLISGKLETIKIYEDNDIFVVLDMYPATLGHMLVMPKQHYHFIQELPDVLLNKIFLFVKTITPILVQITKALGANIFIAQGELAGQKVPHFCINIIPRYEKDNISFEWQKQKIEKKEIEQLGQKLRAQAESVVKEKILLQQAKEIKKQKAREASEAEKISKHVKKRIP